MTIVYKTSKHSSMANYLLDSFWGYPDDTASMYCLTCKASKPHTAKLRTTVIDTHGKNLRIGWVSSFFCSGCGVAAKSNELLATRPIICGKCGSCVTADMNGESVKKLKCRCTEVYQGLMPICESCGNPVKRDPVLFRKVCCDGE